MRQFTVSLGVGVLTAVALTAIRGGYNYAPYLLPVFVAAGFLSTYGVIWLRTPKRLRQPDIDLADRPRLALLRDGVAAGIALSCLIWSGWAIGEAGYRGWLVALFLCVVIPLVVCLVSVRLPIVWGLLAATCIAASGLAHHPRFGPGLFEPRVWEGFWDRDAAEWAVIWMVLAGLSLVVSVPLALHRAHRTRQST